MRNLPPQSADETDAEMSALFATLKDDRAPADLEARLLGGLAAVTVASAAATAAKVTLWQKIGLWLGTSGLTKSVIIGALCGCAASGAIVVVDAPERQAAPEVSGVGSRPAGSQTGSPAAVPGNEKGADGAEVLGASGAPGAPGMAAPGGNETPERERNGQGVMAARSASPALSSLSVAPSAAPSVAVVTAGGGAASSAPSSGSARASDALQKELPLVRAIAALVDAGRCPEARAAIAAYRNENRAGQLAGEVDVLAARCQGRQ